MSSRGNVQFACRGQWPYAAATANALAGSSSDVHFDTASKFSGQLPKVEGLMIG